MAARSPAGFLLWRRRFFTGQRVWRLMAGMDPVPKWARTYWNRCGESLRDFAFCRVASPEALFIQGLIHLAAAAVKIREGKPTCVSRHTRRARELLGEMISGSLGGTLGLDPESISSVVAELEGYIPAC